MKRFLSLLAVGAVSVALANDASAQSRNFGAERFIMDDGDGHVMTLQTQPLMDGNPTYTFPQFTGINSANVVLDQGVFTLNGQYTFTQEIIVNTGINPDLFINENEIHRAGSIGINPGAGNFLTTNGGVSQTGAANQNTFAGNIDATNGLDITGAPLTVGGTNFSVDQTGNVVFGNNPSNQTITKLGGSNLIVNTTGGDFYLQGDGFFLNGNGGGEINTTTDATTIIGNSAGTNSATTIGVGSSGNLTLLGIDADALPTTMLSINGANQVRATPLAGTAEQGVVFTAGQYKLGSAAADGVNFNDFDENRFVNLDAFNLSFTRNAGTENAIVMNGATDQIDINTGSGVTNIGNAAGTNNLAGQSHFDGTGIGARPVILVDNVPVGQYGIRVNVSGATNGIKIDNASGLGTGIDVDPFDVGINVDAVTTGINIVNATTSLRTDNGATIGDGVGADPTTIRGTTNINTTGGQTTNIGTVVNPVNIAGAVGINAGIGYMGSTTIGNLSSPGLGDGNVSILSDATSTITVTGPTNINTSGAGATSIGNAATGGAVAVATPGNFTVVSDDFLVDAAGNTTIDGTTTHNNSVFIQTAATAYPGDVQSVALRAAAPGTSWTGGGVFGGTGAGARAVIAGQLSGHAAIGGHNGLLSTWEDLYVNEVGGNVRIGSSVAPTSKLDVAGSFANTGTANIATAAASATNIGSVAGGDVTVSVDDNTTNLRLVGIINDAAPTHMLTKVNGTNEVRATALSGTAEQGVVFTAGQYKLGSAAADGVNFNDFDENRFVNLDAFNLSFTRNAGTENAIVLNGGAAGSVDVNTGSGNVNLGNAGGTNTILGTTNVDGNTTINDGVTAFTTNIATGGNTGVVNIGSAGTGGAVTIASGSDITLNADGGANDVVVSGDILPSLDNNWSLGSPTQRWINVYATPASLHTYGTAAEVGGSVRDWSMGINATGSFRIGEVATAADAELFTISPAGNVSVAGTLGVTGTGTFQAKNSTTISLRPAAMVLNDYTNIVFSDPDAGTAPMELRYFDNLDPAVRVMNSLGTGSLQVGTAGAINFRVTAATGAMNVAGATTLDGNVTLGNGGDVITIDATASANATLTEDGFDIPAGAAVENFDFSNGGGGVLNVITDGSLTAGTTVTAGTGLTVTTGTATFNDGVTLGSSNADAVTLNGTLTGAGAGHSLGTVGTDANVLTINGLAGVAQELNVVGDATVTGTATVGGLAMSGNLDMNGNDIVDLSDITFSGATNNVTSAGDININANAGTGALSLTAGNFSVASSGVDISTAGAVSGVTALSGTFHGRQAGDGDPVQTINNAAINATSTIIFTYEDPAGVVQNGTITSRAAGTANITFPGNVPVTAFINYIVLN